MSVIISTSVDIEMCYPKGKSGCQYFILTFKKKNHGHRGSGFFLLKPPKTNMESTLFNHVNVIIIIKKYNSYYLLFCHYGSIFIPPQRSYRGYTGFTMSVHPSVEKSYVVR